MSSIYDNFYDMLPPEIIFMIEIELNASYKRDHKDRFQVVLDDYKNMITNTGKYVLEKCENYNYDDETLMMYTILTYFELSKYTIMSRKRKEFFKKYAEDIKHITY
jgi:hypothetical protein